ncbi:MAG TPA: NADH-quinone oxidoreductase subunit N [Candidatus Binatia bacterium]|jgi:NADH-quinone oxidoreductase subunit N|nr:NADH-quinone oxidoreductase subunit N [Candidatus Binatia bacterium]
MGTLESLPLFLPELALSAALLVVIFVDLARSRSGGGEWPGTVAFVGSAAALVLTLRMPGVVGPDGLLAGVPQTWLFGRMIVLDAFSVFFKLLLGLSLVAAVWMSLRSKDVRGRPNEGEYFTVLLGSGIGMFLMASAGNLLMAYLALEFVSLTSYVLTGFLKHNRRSGEAALKYLIYGGVASGAMIYGMSWLFGLTGSMDYAGIAAGVATLSEASRGAFFVAMLLVLAGFGYKIAAVPFHMWAPDVYTGAPLPVTAFLAIGSKAAGFAMLLRFLHFGVTATGPSPIVASVPLVQLLSVLSALTMTLGNLAAMSQTNMKRLLAYSSISHAGYALLGVVVFRDAGVAAVLLYLATYYLMNLGAFVIVMLVTNESGREDMDAYRGLAWRGGAWPAVMLAIFLFSLAGLPPLAGFIGKFYIFAAGIEGGMYTLVLIAVLNSVVSLYYYARIVKMMFLDQPLASDPVLRFGVGDLGVVSVLSFATVFLVVQFGWLLRTVEGAGRVFGG